LPIYRSISKTKTIPEREADILKFWRDNRIFEKSLEINRNGPKFVFYEGPPTANGKPGCHHVLARVFKDLFPRYKTMLGFYVERKAGWDTHGLPVELEVEKELKLASKTDIEKYGIDRFNKKCKESVLRYESAWRKLTERIGFWLDMDNPYITFTNDYIESVWAILKNIWEQGLLYKDYKVVPYCPRCGTSLSSHEVSQGYEEVDDPSIFVKFPIKENLYFLVWTTTPWTLAGNAALAVHPDVTYARVSYENEEYILAESLVEPVLGEEAKIIERFPGKDLVRWRYNPLYSFIIPSEEAHYVVSADFVVLTEGTGIVHIAPAYGEDDMAVGRKYGLPVLHPVGLDGKYKPGMGPWSGLFVKEADPLIIEDLKQRGLLLKSTLYHHSYPFCWRCHSPLLYYAKSSWFIRMTERRDELISANKQVNWYPEYIKEGRFGDWLENVADWALSRERYWGTPLPIWRCSGCDHEEAIGSISELREKARELPEDIELHRPFIDQVKLACPRCGAEMVRTPEVIDTWFDSGSMPYAQWHYPMENEEKFRANFPADFICEAIDQTRGWFYTLLAIGTLIEGKSPYKNVVCLGHILDKDGKKMSKHLGNVVDPWVVLNEYGADAFRWFFYSEGSPWTSRRFYPEAVGEVNRKFLDTLRNSYAFFVLYANVDEIDGRWATENAGVKRSVMDRWILSRLNTTVKNVRGYLDNYDVNRAARTMELFVDDLSNWYIRRCRRRFWAPGKDKDKINAYATLWQVLVTFAKLSAPFIPFFAEEIYQNLVRSTDDAAPESVHLCQFPLPEENLIDRELVNLGRAARNKSSLKIRQPLSLALVNLPESEVPIGWGELESQILEELNLKEVRFVADDSEYSSYSLQPNFSRLGPKLGSKVGQVKARLAKLGQDEIKKGLREGKFKVSSNGEELELDIEDVNLEKTTKDGWAVVCDQGRCLALCTDLTPELISEGLARELVNKVQNMRKQADFNVLDRIEIFVDSTDEVLGAIEDHKEYIMRETLADRIVVSSDRSTGLDFQEWNINGQPARLAVMKRS